jgi:hypothetical protein
MVSKSEDCSLQTMLQGAVAEETSMSTRMEILSLNTLTVYITLTTCM